jgi:hypothetical protein
MRRTAAAACIVLASTALVAFLASELATDRIAAIQRLWWVPRPPFAAGCALLAALALALAWPVRRTRATAMAMLAAAIACLAFAIDRDVGFPRERAAGGFRVLHWNAAWISPKVADAAIEAILAEDADAIVVSNVGQLLFDGRAARVVDRGYRIHRAGGFALLARDAVVFAQPLVAADRGASVSRFELETPAGPLSIEAVDLPSDPDIGRFQLVGELARQLGSKREAPPDLFVGDFNIPRGSASLRLLAPDAVDAFRAAGVGLGYTFPRERPWLAIDLALARPPWRAVRAEISDPGAGRHRLQVVDLERAVDDGQRR